MLWRGDCRSGKVSNGHNGHLKKLIYESFLTIKFQKKLSHIPVKISEILLQTTGIPVGFHKSQLSSRYFSGISEEWLWNSVKFHPAQLDKNVGGFLLGFQWNSSGNQVKILSRFLWKTLENTILKINMLHNFSCLETRFRLLCC